MTGTYRIHGVDSSPYTAKVRAVMRYRHIPHVWLCRFPQFHEETQHIRPPLMPMVQFPNGDYRTDSTPIIYAIEAEADGERSVIPGDPGDAFLSLLIEDFADEWLTKALFYHRFQTREAGEFAARWVMDDSFEGLDANTFQSRVTEFRQRQVSRMPLVGVTEANGPVIERTALETLAAVESFAAGGRFLFGTRPSLGDFGLYAQLRTLGSDPVGLALTRRHAPRTESWWRRLDDASGVEGEWAPASEPTVPVVKLLTLIGETYLPFLAENERARREGDAELDVTLDGAPFRAAPFAYQVKCLDWLRRDFAALPAASLERLRPALEATGCWTYLSSE